MTEPTALPPALDPATWAPVAPEPPEPPLRAWVLAELREQGLDPAVDEDGDVGVVRSGQMLFLRCVESQPPLVRVFGQWILDPASGTEMTWLRAANAVTGSLNLIKATVHGDRLVIAADLVIGEDIALGPLLASSLEAVLGSARTWHETVTELQSPTRDGGWPAGRL